MVTVLNLLPFSSTLEAADLMYEMFEYLELKKK